MRSVKDLVDEVSDTFASLLPRDAKFIFHLAHTDIGQGITRVGASAWPFVYNTIKRLDLHVLEGVFLVAQLTVSITNSRFVLI